MRKVILFSIVGLLVTVGILYSIFWNHLPPRTPHKIARIESGLSIPGSWKVSEFKDNWSFTGDGFVLVVFDLDDRKKEILLEQEEAGEFTNFPIIDQLQGTFLFQGGYLDNSDFGIYKFTEIGEYSFSATIINKTKNKLIVFKSI
jgi:hypothetical protein